MEDARIRDTDEPVTGEDLWYMDDVEDNTYECVFCSTECRPCSYDKDVNLRRPHFRILGKHSPGCLYDAADSKTIKDNKLKKIRDEEGKPGHYPSKFAFPRDRAKGEAQSKPTPNNKNPSNQDHPSDRDKGLNRRIAKDRPYRTSSFRLLVNHYINFPYDRDLPLEAESISGNSFKTCFKSLFTNKDAPLIKPKNKIYYSTSKWSKPEIRDHLITIKFNAYIEVDCRGGSKTNKENLYLEVDTSSWPQTVKDSFMHDFEKGRLDAIKSDGNKKLLVFFIGEQDVNTPLKFIASNARLISFNVV